MGSLNIRTAVSVAAAVLVAVCASPAAASGNASRNTRMVVVSQVITSPTVGMTSTLTVDIGTGTYSNGSLSMAKGARRLDDAAASFPRMQVIDYNNQTKSVCTGPSRPFWKPGMDDSDYGTPGGCQTVGLTDGDVTAMVDGAVVPLAPSIVTQLTSIIGANDAASGVFTFEQELGSTALSGRRRLVWSLFIDPTGRAIYGKSKIITTSKYYLYVSYTPKAVAEGLPQSWEYQSPGVLSWTIVDSKMKALQAATTLDTGGYFDEPDGQTGDEAKLACLMDSAAAGCSSPYPDVASLLAQSGADGAFVDYLHLVAPVYQTIESPAGSGDYVSIAQFILQAPVRSLTTAFDPTCLIKTYTYANSGQYQFNLNHAMTRYYIDKGKREYTAAGQMAKTVQSPWQSYSNSMVVDAATLPALPDLYIDPFGQEGPLVSVGYLPAGSAVGAVDYVAPPVCVPVIPPTPPVGP